jgi:hypothetical protein
MLLKNSLSWVMLKCRILIELFVEYIDTGSPVPNIPSKSCGLADEYNKLLMEWKWFETSVYVFSNLGKISRCSLYIFYLVLDIEVYSLNLLFCDRSNYIDFCSTQQIALQNHCTVMFELIKLLSGKAPRLIPSMTAHIINGVLIDKVTWNLVGNNIC